MNQTAYEPNNGLASTVPTPEQRLPGVPLRIDVSRATPSTVSVGRYRVLAQLGEGAMANVYLAHCAGVGGFGRFFALKVLREHLIDKREWKHKFLDEARLAASIHHPHVVPVYEVGIDRDRYYFAMEYIRGETLDHLLRRCAKLGSPLKTHLVAHLLAQVADGLHAAHELRDASGRLLDVVHRDAVPRNILVGFDGTARLGDFGIAKAVDKRSRTEPGMMHGTIAYCAPEYLTEQRSDRRTDIFTLGVVLFEATTGLRLFRRARDVDTLRSVLEAKVPRPSAIVEGYPRELEEIVLRALQRNPGDRQQSALELSDALRAFVAACDLRTDLTAEIRRTMMDAFAARYADRMQLEARARALLEDPEAGTDTPLVAMSSFSDELAPVEVIALTPKPEVETVVGPPADILDTIEIQESAPIDVDFALDPEVTEVPPPFEEATLIRTPLPRAVTPRRPSRPITPPPVKVSIEIPDLPLPPPEKKRHVTSTMVVRRRMIPRIRSGIDAPPIEAGPEERPRAVSLLTARISRPRTLTPRLKPSPARGGALAAGIAIVLSALFLAVREYTVVEPVTEARPEVAAPLPPKKVEAPAISAETPPPRVRESTKPKKIRRRPAPPKREEPWDPLESPLLFDGKDL